MTVSASASHTKTVKGQPTTLTARYKSGTTPVKSGSLKVQRLRSGKWKIFKTVKVSNGQVKVKVGPHISASYRFTTNSGKTVSKLVKVAVSKSKPAAKPTLTAKASATSITKGKKVSLTAAYTAGGKPVRAGTLYVQRLRSGKWTTFRTITVKNGRDSTTVGPHINASYRFLTPNGKLASKLTNISVGRPSTQRRGLLKHQPPRQSRRVSRSMGLVTDME